MARRAWIAPGVLAAALTFAPCVPALADDSAVGERAAAAAERLSALHRSLHSVHDAAVADPAAPALAAALGRRLDAALAAVPPTTWDDPRAVAALAGRALSGGTADALRPVLDAANERMPPALAEAMALHLARSPSAATALEAALPDVPVDVLPLAHLALGSLAADPVAKARHLRRAALLAPGTLVDEAAIRRRLTLPPGDAAEAAEWIRAAFTHTHRFPRSPHRTATLDAIARGLATRAAHVATGTVEALLDAAPTLAAPLAREAVLEGATAMAEQALARSNGNARTQSYRAAIRVAADAGSVAATQDAAPALDPSDSTSGDFSEGIAKLDRARAAMAAAIAMPPTMPARAARAHPMKDEATATPVLDGLDEALAAARAALERTQ